MTRRAIVAMVGLVAIGALTVASTLAPGPTVAIAGFDVRDDLSSATLTLVADGSFRAWLGRQTLDDTNGVVTVPLDFDASGSGQEARQVVLRGGTGPMIGFLRVEYYPRALYAAVGSADPGYVQLVSDLPRVAVFAEPPGTTTPPAPAQMTSAAADFWRQRWAESGGLPAVGDLETAAGRLMTRIWSVNRSDVGPLCADDLPAPEMYDRVEAGGCWVWCTGLSVMFSDALRAAGLPSRQVGLVPARSAVSNGTIVQSSEAHTTVEAYVDGGWRWIDPSFRILRAEDAAGRRLSVSETIRGLSDPATRPAIRLTYLPEGATSPVSAGFDGLDKALRDNLLRYLTADKTVLYGA